jgi:sialate O-acetylesterase
MKSIGCSSAVLAAIAIFGAPSRLSADIRLPGIISDHMVLMRASAVPIWGKAEVGEAVTVTFDGKTASTVAAADGNWSVNLDLATAAPGPHQLEIKGKNEIRISDVLVGAVWIASGQSNMEFSLRGSIGAEEEIAHSLNPQLRQFKADKVLSPVPMETGKGHWVIASPETSGAFSAVGYYFGKRVQEELGLPVGIVNLSWGGTIAEFWISAEGIGKVDSLRAGDARQRKLAGEYPARKQRFVESYAAWLRTNSREDHPCPDPASFASPSTDTSGWERVKLPGPISSTSATGVVWIRKEIEVPAGVVGNGQDFKVSLGRLEGFEQVYWNGTKVSETPYQKYPGEGYTRYFAIPNQHLHAGRNTIAVRIFAPAIPPRTAIAPDAFNAGTVSLLGEWLAKTEYEFPPLSAPARAAAPKSPGRAPEVLASAIFNGVVNPLTNYAVAGVVWYQGESNIGRAWEYRTLLPLLIADWREKWKRNDLPFYICQLPASGVKKSSPAESEWAELREAQAATLKTPGTDMVVLIDLGEAKDLHPRNKVEVGERLARVVLAREYGRELVSSGPVYDSISVENDRVRIRFHHADGGLIAKAIPPVYDLSTLLTQTAPLVRNSPHGELEGFQICGEDRHWVWADARIDGASVLVRSDQVPHPVAVRYAWADNPTVNLVNGAGLPAAPFRTDDFPAMTVRNHF